MNKKETLKNLINSFNEEICIIDCLIRMMKEVLSCNGEMREEDIYYIYKLLIKSSQNMNNQLKELKLQVEI